MVSPLGKQGMSPIVERLERFVYIHLLIVIPGVLSKSSLLVFLDGFDVLLWSSFLVSTWVIYMGPQLYDNSLILSTNRCFHVISQKFFVCMRQCRISLTFHHQLRPPRPRWPSSLGQSVSVLKSIIGRLSQRNIHDCLLEKSDTDFDELSSTEAVSMPSLMAPPRQITLDRGGVATRPPFFPAHHILRDKDT